MSIYLLTQDYLPNIQLNCASLNTPNINIVNADLELQYSLPYDKPNSPSLLEVLPNGDPVWIDASTLIGNPNALISTNPLVEPIAGSVVVYTGDASNLDVNSQNILVVDTITNTVKINDASSSGEFTTITTIGATYINHNGGSSGLVLDAGTGDLTLTTSKFEGVVNVNSFNGLQFNGVGLINNINSDLRMYNGDGDVLIASKQNNVIVEVSEELIYSNLATGANYRIVPTTQASDNSIIQYQSNGSCAFIPTPSGGGSANAFINSQPSTVPLTRSVLIADGGGNAFNSHPSPVQIISNPATTLISLTASNDPNLGAALSYSINDGALILENLDNSISRDNYIRIDQNIVLDTTNSNITGNIELSASGNIQLTGGVNITGGDNTNNIYKDSGNQLTLKGENNVYLNSSGGSTFIQSAGGNINLQSPNGAIYSNNSTYFQSYATFNGDITATANISLQNNSRFTLPDQTTGSIGQLQQDTAGIFNITNSRSINVASLSKSILLDEYNNKLTINNNNGASLTELISPNIDIYTSSLKLRSQSNLNSYTLPNPDTLPNDGDIIVFNSGVGSFTAPTIPNQTQSFYVSKTGVDTLTAGSAVLPFLTISYALDQANLLSASTKTTIYIYNGTYTEDLTITKNNLVLSSMGSIPQQTVINSITYNIDGDGSNISSSLFGLTINYVLYAGTAFNDTGSFIIAGCILGQTAGFVPLLINYVGSGVRDYTLNNCVIVAVDTYAIYQRSGRINMTACLTTQSTTSNIYPVIFTLNDALISLFGCQVYSSNITASAPPVISLNNSIAPSSSYQFNSSTIGYYVGTIDTQVILTKCCVSCFNTVSISMVIFNNKFDGTGTRLTNSGSNYVIINKGGSGGLSIQYGQNIGSPTVHKLPSGAGLTQLTTVVP